MNHDYENPAYEDDRDDSADFLHVPQRLEQAVAPTEAEYKALWSGDVVDSSTYGDCDH